MLQIMPRARINSVHNPFNITEHNDQILSPCLLTKKQVAKITEMASSGMNETDTINPAEFSNVSHIHTSTYLQPTNFFNTSPETFEMNNGGT